jgi:hypothetical protein
VRDFTNTLAWPLGAQGVFTLSRFLFLHSQHPNINNNNSKVIKTATSTATPTAAENFKKKKKFENNNKKREKKEKINIKRQTKI